MKPPFRLFALLALCALTLLSQANTGYLKGRVLDSSGAIVEKAAVQITQTQTGLTRKGQSDTEGAYEFPLLPPGSYEIVVQRPGFKAGLYSGVVVAAGDRLRLELVLVPGDTSERITVVGDAPLANTESSSMGFVVGGRQVESLPLNSSNFFQLVALGTGIIPSRPNTVISYTFNGSSQYGMNLSMDGTDASFIETPTFGDPSQQSRLNTVSPDSIEQLEVKTGTFSAETGRATGGLVNVITKSGTNAYHGSLYEYFRNDKLDARNFFAAAKSPLRQNQFGGTVGGPIVKEKLFFFGGYEASRALIGQQISSNVPTASFRAQAPAAFASYLALVPLPTQAVAGSATTGLYQRSDNFISNENLANFRIDYIKQANTLFVRYSLNKSDNSTPNLILANRQLYPIANHVVTIGDTLVISPSTLNEARLGWDRWDVPRHNTTFDGGLGGITISGILTSGNSEGLLHFVDSTYTLSDTLIHRAGSHSLRAGAEIRRLDSNRTQRANPNFSFTSAAAFLANTPASVTVTYGNLGTDLRQYQQGYFFQDDWRARPNLTINLGLRYDYFTPLGAADGRMVSTGADPFGPFQPRGTALWKATRTNFEPRVGFAWDMMGNQKTILRGGFGQYVIPLPPFFIWNAATIDPRLPATASYTPVDVPGLSFPLSGALLAAYQNPLGAVAAALAPAVVSRFVVDPNRHDSYSLTANLTVERQLSSNLLLQTSFVATRHLHSPEARALNLVNPATGKRIDATIGEIDLSESAGRRNYNALQVSLRKRFSYGLTGNVNYTWSHTIVYAGDDAFGPNAVQNWSDIASSRGSSSLDLRHTLVIDASWQIPAGRSAAGGWSRALLRGWGLSSIVQMRSGIPVNLVTGRDIFGNGYPSTQRPNYVGGSIYSANQGVTSWFTPAAFANPAPGTFGNIGYDAGNGPIRLQIDMAVARQFTLWHEHSLQFRLDAFNLPNRANFFNPDNNINSATFGRITSADNPRQVQLSLRYRF